jgi:hypothetical protein
MRTAYVVGARGGEGVMRTAYVVGARGGDHEDCMCSSSTSPLARRHAEQQHNYGSCQAAQKIANKIIPSLPQAPPHPKRTHRMDHGQEDLWIKILATGEDFGSHSGVAGVAPLHCLRAATWHRCSTESQAVWAGVGVGRHLQGWRGVAAWLERQRGDMCSGSMGGGENWARHCALLGFELSCNLAGHGGGGPRARMCMRRGE